MTTICAPRPSSAHKRGRGAAVAEAAELPAQTEHPPNGPPTRTWPTLACSARVGRWPSGWHLTPILMVRSAPAGGKGVTPTTANPPARGSKRPATDANAGKNA